MGKPCQLCEAERQKIQQWTAAHGTPQQVALRCRIVLAAASGESDVAIAKLLSVNRNTVVLWRKRFAAEGLDGLWDIAPGRGRKPTYQIDKLAAILDATVQTKPAGMTHWSCRTMAQSQGVSKSTVNNIWRAHNLQPHRTETFKLSRDPKFLEKLTDVVGLYLNPPQQAIILCVDEKSQIQALDRTQPGLPIKPGRCGTMTHDYKRNGTTTLFAALDTLQGKVVGECHQRHRHQEFLKFLRRLDQEFPGQVPLHLASLSQFDPPDRGFCGKNRRKPFYFSGTLRRDACRPGLPSFQAAQSLAFWRADAHLKVHRRKKDGKEHRYFSIVESRRVSRRRVVHRTVVYLGEINDTQQTAWRKTLEVFDEKQQEFAALSQFPDDREIATRCRWLAGQVE